MKSTKKLLEMLRDEAVEKLPMKDMGLCFLICNSTDKRKVSSKERDRLYMYILRNAPKDATLHAQRIADKMVEERLKNAPKNCPKAAQCAHVEGGMKCPPNVICPI